MVRAASTGAFNYAKADPSNRQWRLRHTLILRDVARQADAQILAEVHRHWLAYVSHSNLEPDGWANIKRQAAKTLENLQRAVFPWVAGEEKEGGPDTINNKYADLIAQYRKMVESNKTAKLVLDSNPETK
jgi:hypothetical protein